MTSSLAALMKIEVPDVEVENNDKIVVCMKLHKALKNLMQSLLLSRSSRGNCSATGLQFDCFLGCDWSVLPFLYHRQYI